MPSEPTAACGPLLRDGPGRDALQEVRAEAVNPEGSAATRYELHIRITAFSRDEAMMLARRTWDAIREDAERLTVHEETTMPILKQVGSIGISRAR